MASLGAHRELTGRIDQSRDIAISEMRSLRFLPSREAGFVKPMECLAVTKLPDGPEWVYEIKLDGYRALAINANGKLTLYSRRRKSFNRQYQHVFDALRELPQNSVVDGEIVALDDAGRPNFNFLQHSRSQAKRVCYFVFDLLVCNNRDLMQLPLVERRELLKQTSNSGHRGYALPNTLRPPPRQCSKAPPSKD